MILCICNYKYVLLYDSILGLMICIQSVYEMDTQVRLGKDRLGKDNNTISKDIVSSTKVQPVIEKWNSLNLQKLVCIKEGTNRYKLLNARIKDYGIDSVLKAIDMLHERVEGTARKNFGNNKKHFILGEDYIVIKPSDVNNFPIPINNAGLTLITESGYLMLVKSLQDDLAWRV